MPAKMSSGKLPTISQEQTLRFLKADMSRRKPCASLLRQALASTRTAHKYGIEMIDRFEENDRKKWNQHEPVFVGVRFAVLHIFAFLVSVACVGLMEGWAGVFIWPVWAIVDFPCSLLYYFYQSINKTFFYPPYFIHGVVGTIWWCLIPTIYFKMRTRKS